MTRYRAFLIVIILLFISALAAQPEQKQTTESAQNQRQKNSFEDETANKKASEYFDTEDTGVYLDESDPKSMLPSVKGPEDLPFAKSTSPTQDAGQKQTSSSKSNSVSKLSTSLSQKDSTGGSTAATSTNQATIPGSPFTSGISSNSDTSSSGTSSQASNPQPNTNNDSPTTQSPTSSTVPVTAPTTSTQTPPSPSCGAHWGAYVNSPQRTGGYNASDKLQAISYVENQMGRTFDIDHQFYRWDDFVSTYNITNYIKPSIAQGRKPFLSWKPVYKNNTNIAWASIADGDHDVLIRQKAQQVKSIGSPVILVFGHEADSRIGTFQPGQTESGHVKTDAGSAADFVAAYRHVHTVFAQEGVTNVDWAWIMTRAPFEPNAGARAANLLYPGDSYVDIVGLDPYNFFHGGNWREMQTLMGGFTSWATANNITKPWMLAEWGSVEDPNQAGRKAQWLRNAADYFESEPRIKYLIHFDSFPEYNWRFDSSPSSASAWAEISNRSYFTCP